MISLGIGTFMFSRAIQMKRARYPPVIEEVDDDVHRSPLCINDAAGRKQKYLEESPA